MASLGRPADQSGQTEPRRRSAAPSIRLVVPRQPEVRLVSNQPLKLPGDACCAFGARSRASENGSFALSSRPPAAYLRRSVVNECASVLRRRGAAERVVLVDVPWGMEHQVLLDGNAVIAALDVLPRRRREAVVLRYYLGLSEKEAASAMGCAPGSVRSHAARGLAALHWTVEELRAEAEAYLESRSRTDRSKSKLSL